MEKIKIAYYFIYYVIFHFDLSISTREFSKWKSLAIVSLLHGAVLVSMDLWIEIIFGKGFFLNLSIPLFSIICLAIVVLNYFILIHNNKWEDYANEFDSYTNKKKGIGRWLVFLFIFSILFFLMYSFYRFGQIDFATT